VYLLKDFDDPSDDLQEWVDGYRLHILPAVLASLVGMLVMTSENMPKIVYREDLIEKSTKLASTQLSGVIYRSTSSLRRARGKFTMVKLAH